VITLGVIPARGGSKGVPRKNLALLGGRPLIAWTCDAARASRRLDRVLLSSDDDEIAAAAAACGITSPYPRPAALATDDAQILDVLVDLLKTIERIERYTPDAVALLQPTSPLRTAQHIDDAVALLDESGADSVVTVMRVPHQFNPVSVLTMEAGRLQPFLPGPTITRRQDKPAVFARNGPAVLVTRREVLESGRLYGDDVRGHEMSARESVDIDEPADLELAAWWLERNGGYTIE
jgi:CMP-N,N'-diacetyllegionaminic acid synthase